jgi:uncharacterized protein HemX
MMVVGSIANTRLKDSPPPAPHITRPQEELIQTRTVLVAVDSTSKQHIIKKKWLTASLAHQRASLIISYYPTTLTGTTSESGTIFVLLLVVVLVFLLVASSYACEQQQQNYGFAHSS